MFKMLDSNKDGLLDFEDILVLFYAEERDVIRLIPCDGYCGGLLSGPYFSCISCLSKFPNTFDLCCHCYGRGDFQHHHPTTNFLHDQGLVAKLMGQPKTQLTVRINNVDFPFKYECAHITCTKVQSRNRVTIDFEPSHRTCTRDNPKIWSCHACESSKRTLNYTISTAGIDACHSYVPCGSGYKFFVSEGYLSVFFFLAQKGI